jgi:hypothetical protein
MIALRDLSVGVVAATRFGNANAGNDQQRADETSAGSANDVEVEIVEARHDLILRRAIDLHQRCCSDTKVSSRIIRKSAIDKHQCKQKNVRRFIGGRCGARLRRRILGSGRLDDRKRRKVIGAAAQQRLVLRYDAVVDTTPAVVVDVVVRQTTFGAVVVGRRRRQTEFGRRAELLGNFVVARGEQRYDRRFQTAFGVVDVGAACRSIVRNLNRNRTRE